MLSSILCGLVFLSFKPEAPLLKQHHGVLSQSSVTYLTC